MQAMCGWNGLVSLNLKSISITILNLIQYIFRIFYWFLFFGKLQYFFLFLFFFTVILISRNNHNTRIRRENRWTVINLSLMKLAQLLLDWLISLSVASLHHQIRLILHVTIFHVRHGKCLQKKKKKKHVETKRCSYLSSNLSKWGHEERKHKSI